MSQEQSAEGVERRFPHERTNTLDRACSNSPHSRDGVVLGILRYTARFRYRPYPERYLLAVNTDAPCRSFRFPCRVSSLQRYVALRRHPGPSTDFQGDISRLYRLRYPPNMALRVGWLPEKRLPHRFCRQHFPVVWYPVGRQNPP